MLNESNVAELLHEVCTRHGNRPFTHPALMLLYLDIRSPPHRWKRVYITLNMSLHSVLALAMVVESMVGTHTVMLGPRMCTSLSHSPPPLGWDVAEAPDVGALIESAAYCLKLLPLDACPLMVIATDGTCVVVSAIDSGDDHLMTNCSPLCVTRPIWPPGRRCHHTTSAAL